MNTHLMPVTTSELVVVLLRRNGRNQQWLADQLGLSLSSVIKKINGRRSWSEAETRQVLAILLPRLDSNQQPVGYWLAA